MYVFLRTHTHTHRTNRTYIVAHTHRTRRRSICNTSTRGSLPYNLVSVHCVCCWHTEQRHVAVSRSEEGRMKYSRSRCTERFFLFAVARSNERWSTQSALDDTRLHLLHFFCGRIIFGGDSGGSKGVHAMTLFSSTSFCVDRLKHHYDNDALFYLRN